MNLKTGKKFWYLAGLIWRGTNGFLALLKSQAITDGIPSALSEVMQSSKNDAYCASRWFTTLYLLIAVRARHSKPPLNSSWPQMRALLGAFNEGLNSPACRGGKFLCFHALFMIRHSIGASKVCWRNLRDFRSGQFNHTRGGIGFGDAFVMVVRSNLSDRCYDIL